MDYKELKIENDRLKAEIETYHLFYEDFTKYDEAISNASAVLMQMLSTVVGIKKKGNNSKNVTDQEEKIHTLLGIFEMMLGLNNRCQSQKLLIKHQAQDKFFLEQKIKILTDELTAIKKAHNEK